GANGYLLKTAEIEKVVEAIRTVHQGQSALAPAVAGKVVAQFTSGKSLPDTLKPQEEQFEGLTDRELGILKLVGQGLSNKQIGKELFISDRTVQAHLSNIFSKLGVSSRTEAVMYAVRKDWITIGQG
ncbi:MAG: response regulator transcription factor, partial [Chloroflexota bacterium]